MQMERPSSSSLRPQRELCNASEKISFIISLLVVHVLLTPLFLYVVAIGYQRWRKDGFLAPFTAWSHIDIFTYDVVVIDLVNIWGIFVLLFGLIIEESGLQEAGRGMFSIYFAGQTLFHLLTCMERYLAVVHPVFYLRLKGSAGVRLRNVTIGCVWMIYILITVLIVQRVISFATMNGLLLSITFLAFFFCSLSVLCALIGPGPGGPRDLVDQSKKRAIKTILIITGSLFLRFMSSLISSVIQNVAKQFGNVPCLIGWSPRWFFWPSSLVLPLLFLQRAGKLNICGANVKRNGIYKNTVMFSLEILFCSVTVQFKQRNSDYAPYC